jgi:hypothetical protein
MQFKMELRPILNKNKIHFIIAHTAPHARWADDIETQLRNFVLDVFPSVKVTIAHLLIKESAEEIKQDIQKYHDSYTPAQADETYIISIGWHESQAMSALCSDTILPYTQLFCLPSGPTEKVLQTMVSHRSHLAGGVYSTPLTPTRYVNSILGFNNKTKKICIAYDPAPSSEELKDHILQQVAGIEAACALKKIQVIHHHWNPLDGKMQKLRNRLYSGADSVIILNEPAALVHRKKLILLCNVLGKLVCASELDSVIEGAALGGGVNGGAFAGPLASLICENILDNNRLIKSRAPRVKPWMLLQIPEQSGMRFNENAFKSQGVKLTPEQEALLKMKSAFDLSCNEL